MAQNLNFEYMETVTVPLYQVGKTYKIPIIAKTDMDITAISMIIAYPQEKIIINSVEAPSPEFANLISARPNQDELRIGWFGSQPVHISANETFILIEIEVLTPMVNGEEIQLTITDAIENEFADSNIFPIPNLVLLTRTLKATDISGTVAGRKILQGYVSSVDTICKNCKWRLDVQAPKRDRCILGDFAIALGGSCDKFER